MTLYHGDALTVLRELFTDSIDACITSPPYLDARPEYPSPDLRKFEEIAFELHRVVTGGLALNVGRLWRDNRELRWWEGLVQRFENVGWKHLDTLVWIKPNANPIHGAVLAHSHEYAFLMGDHPSVFYPDAVRTPYAEGSEARLERSWDNSRAVKNDGEGHQDRRDANPLGARARSFVSIYVGKEKGIRHPAPMAFDFAKHLILLTVPNGGSVIDPFAGSGTTALAARYHDRSAILIELSKEYASEAAERLQQQSLFAGEEGYE